MIRLLFSIKNTNFKIMMIFDADLFILYIYRDIKIYLEYDSKIQIYFYIEKYRAPDHFIEISIYLSDRNEF